MGAWSFLLAPMSTKPVRRDELTIFWRPVIAIVDVDQNAAKHRLCAEEGEEDDRELEKEKSIKQRKEEGTRFLNFMYTDFSKHSERDPGPKISKPLLSGRTSAVRIRHPPESDLYYHYYRKRGSASYIVREVLSVRERERERLIPNTIGNRKRDCAWGCAWGINTTWENLQIEKHKSVWWAERTPSWFVLFDLQIFSGGVYSPSATSRTISFSISNSVWY